MISVIFQVFISLGLAYYVGLTIVYLTPFCCARFNEKRFTFATDKSLPWASFINEIRIILQISSPIIMLLFYISIIIAIKIVRSYLITFLFVKSKGLQLRLLGKTSLQCGANESWSEDSYSIVHLVCCVLADNHYIEFQKTPLTAASIHKWRWDVYFEHYI